MSILKKSWPFVLAGVIVCIVGFVFWRANTPKPPIKIYKAVDPTQMDTVHQEQGSASETDRHVPQTPDSSQGTVQSTQQTPVREPSGSDITPVEREGKTTDSVTAAPQNTKGAVPPELSSEAMERLHVAHTREQRVSEIMEELSTFANRHLNKEELSRVIELQEELHRIGKENGTFDVEDAAITAAFDHVKFASTHMTEDGRFPTQHGTSLIESLRSAVPDTPERQQAIEQLTRALNIAIENGDKYFKLDPAGE